MSKRIERGARKLRYPGNDPENGPAEWHFWNGTKWVPEKGYSTSEWSGQPDPDDPDNYWIDDKTGERVNAHTGSRSALS